jgi:hypothetical protein
MPVKDLMTAENDYTIRILDNIEIIKEIDPADNSDPYEDVGGRFLLVFIDNGAVYQFDYNKAPKYLKKIVDLPLKQSQSHIKRTWVV